MLIYFYVPPTWLQKSFFRTSVHVFFYTSKYPSSSESLNMLHAGFLYQCIYALQHMTGDGSFYFVCIQSQSIVNTVVAFRYMSYGISLSWKFILIRSFHVFSLPCMYLHSPFIGSRYFYSEVHRNRISETLNDIVWVEVVSHCGSS